MTGNRICPVCDEQKERLARHWSYCEWPTIGTDLKQTLRGILLGAGSLQGNGDAKFLTLRTKHRELAEWLLKQLGWLAHSCRRREGREDHAPTYVARTHAHETLGHWRHRWYESDGRKRLQTDGRLTPHAGRLWWALAGGLEWGEYDSQRRGAFSAAQPDKEQRIAAILTDAGFNPTVYDGRVVLESTVLDAWLEWIGSMVPGVEYKWAPTQTVYRSFKRGRLLSGQAGMTALDVLGYLMEAAHQVGRSPTVAEFDALDLPCSSNLIRRHFGGWDTAKRLVGLEVHIDSDELRRLYWDEGLSLTEVGDELGISADATRELMQEHGIPRRDAGGHNYIDANADELERLYWDGGLSLGGVAEELDMSPATVRQRMEDFGIPRRGPGESPE
jgi:hypothetical protein